MHKRRLLLSTIVTICVSTTAAFSGAVESAISQLKAQGYANISTTKTFLGRTRIVAIRNGSAREIIMQARSGIILRDFTKSTTSTSAETSSNTSGEDAENNGNGNNGNNGNGN